MLGCPCHLTFRRNLQNDFLFIALFLSYRYKQESCLRLWTTPRHLKLPVPIGHSALTQMALPSWTVSEDLIQNQSPSEETRPLRLWHRSFTTKASARASVTSTSTTKVYADSGWIPTKNKTSWKKRKEKKSRAERNNGSPQYFVARFSKGSESIWLWKASGVIRNETHWP